MTCAMPPRRWTTQPEPYRHPAPDVACRPAAEHEIPRGARAIERLAVLHGWATAFTYSRGWTLPVNRSISRHVDVCALRMRRVNERAWAAWHTDGRGSKYDSGAYVGPRGILPLRKVSDARNIISTQHEGASPAACPLDPLSANTTSVAHCATKGMPRDEQ